MPTLADVVRQHGPSYVARFGATALPSHLRAMRDIVSCRTAVLGGHLEHCHDCGRRHLVYHSCRNRACPRCGADRAMQWVERQRDLLLPVPYFHIVFTLPAALRRFVRAHQEELSSVLFKAAFESLSALARDPRHLGGDLGALAVLHTWTRTLQWHPHVHLLVPGGALAFDGTWLPCRRRSDGTPYLLPVHALSTKFWGVFMAHARRRLPGVVFPDLPRNKRWVVHIKPVLAGNRVLEYLGRYIHRTALSDRAVLACDEQRVIFRYRRSSDGRRRVMTLPGHEFLRRYLQHTLPRGLHRIRAFGLLHPSRRTTLRRLQLLLGSPKAFPSTPGLEETAGRKPRVCESCGCTTWHRGPRLNAIECALAEAALRVAADRARGPPTGGVT